MTSPKPGFAELVEDVCSSTRFCSLMGGVAVTVLPHLDLRRGF
jgi:hypothetical protein